MQNCSNYSGNNTKAQSDEEFNKKIKECPKFQLQLIVDETLNKFTISQT